MWALIEDEVWDRPPPDWERWGGPSEGSTENSRTNPFAGAATQHLAVRPKKKRGGQRGNNNAWTHGGRTARIEALRKYARRVIGGARAALALARASQPHRYG